MSKNAQLQRDLDVLISRTEEELANLRSQRNALSTISQLAPELFSAIFSAYLVDFEPCKERRQGLQTLCRVSRAWRDMVFSDTDIWSTLYLGYHANEAFVKLALANSLDRPLRLRIRVQKSLQPWNAIWKVLPMICSTAGQRIQGIDLHATPDDLEGILRGMGGVPHLVASLRIEAHQRDSSFENVMLPVELYGSEVPPNLRRLELEGVATPWSSPILSSRNLLTHVKLRIGNPAYTSKTTSIAHLYEFLKSASQLKSLILEFSVGEDEEFHFPSVPFVSSLETIVITSFYGEQLSALLSAFRFPNLRNIMIIWMPLQPATGLLSSINGAIKGHAGPLEPQEMYVGDGELVVSGGGSFHIDLYQRYNPYAIGRSPPSMRQAKPWINLTAAFREEEAYVFPFHHPSTYAPSWSFSALRVICVHTASFPGFWEMLAQLPALETIEICPSSRVTKDFLGALAGEVTLADEQRNTATFPALRSVLFQSWEPYRDGSAREALAVSVVRALEARASKVGKSSGESPLRLESLEFLSCWGAIGQTALEALNRVAEIVVWKFPNKSR